jgi:hypothetical protein
MPRTSDSFMIFMCGTFVCIKSHGLKTKLITPIHMSIVNNES